MSTFTTATASGRGQFQTSSSSPSSLVSFVIVLCTLVIMMTTTIPAIAAAVANTPLTRSLQTQSENTSARRALYLQVYSTYSGNFAFSANASWAQFTYVMQTDWSQDVLVYYLTKYGFNTISLYNVHNALGAPAPTAQFRTLLRTLRARVAGLRIEGIADDYIPAWTRMAAYQNASTDPNEMFDGFVTEIEFWGGANDPSELIASLTHMQQVDRPKQRIPGTPLYYAVYLGNLNQAATTALVESGVVDLMMFHCYVKSPTTCGSYTAARLGYMQIAESNYVATHGVPSRTNGAFAVILSGEGSLYRAGGGSFSGDWMFAQHLANKSANTVAVTEEAATASIGDYKSTAPLLRMQGYQAYEYCFYAVYTGDTMPQADWVALLAQTTTTTTAATASPTSSTTTITTQPPIVNVTNRYRLTMELMSGSTAEDVRRDIVSKFALNNNSVVVFVIVRIMSTVGVASRGFNVKDDATTTTTTDDGMVESVQMDFTGDVAVAAAHSLEVLPVADSELIGLKIAKVTDGVVLAAPTEDNGDGSQSGNTTIIIIVICAVAVLLVLIAVFMVYCCYRHARGKIVNASSVYGEEETSQPFFGADGMHLGGNDNTTAVATGGGGRGAASKLKSGYHVQDAELDDLDMGALANNNDVNINLNDTESDGHLLSTQFKETTRHHQPRKW